MRRSHLGLLIVCILAILIRVIVLLQSMSPWWDPAIYVGMAKFLFSGGDMGIWETLRPPLLPVMIGILWQFNFDALLSAKIIIFTSSIASIITLYFFAEREKPGLGLAAALIFTLSPIYSFFTAIPTSDIPSVFFALLGAFMLLRKKYLYSGLFVSLSFLTRFPNGLFLVPFGLFIIIESYSGNWKKSLQDASKKIGKLALSFAALAVPYFIINDFMFSDPFLPLKLGRQVIEGNPSISPFYYMIAVVVDNPLTLLCLIGIYFYLRSTIKDKKIPASPTTLSILCAAIIGGYLSSVGHKELRYSISFAPFVAIIAAYGLSYLWDLSKKKNARTIALCIVFFVGVINMQYEAMLHYRFIAPLSTQREAYYRIPTQGSATITSSPQIMIFSDTKIIDYFSTWEGAAEILNARKDTVDFVAIDSSQISCSSSECDKAKDSVKKMLEQATLEYFAYEKDIELIVYRIRRNQ